MATFRKKQGLWEARRRLPGGRRLSFYGKTAEEAEDLANAATGHHSRFSNPTLSEYACRAYIPTVKSHSEGWRSQIAWVLDGHVFPALGNADISAITRQDLQLFLTGKLASLSRTSVGHIRKVLFAIYALAEADGLVARNPVRFVKLPPPKPVRKQLYGAADIGALLKALDGPPRNAVYLAATIALTKSEALRLEWRDISNQTVSIREGKTASRVRLIFVPDGWGDGLVKSRGSKVVACSMSTLHREFYEARKAIGHTTFHNLRSACATGLESLGCPRHVTRAILGHAAGSVTDRYAVVQPDTMRSWLAEWLCQIQVGVQSGRTAACKREGKNGLF